MTYVYILILYVLYIFTTVLTVRFQPRRVAPALLTTATVIAVTALVLPSLADYSSLPEIFVAMCVMTVAGGCLLGTVINWSTAKPQPKTTNDHTER